MGVGLAVATLLFKLSALPAVHDDGARSPSLRARRQKRERGATRPGAEPPNGSSRLMKSDPSGSTVTAVPGTPGKKAPDPLLTRM